MSKLEKLFGKGKELEIEGIHIDVKPLTVNSLPLLMKVSQEENPEAQAEAMQEILKRTLKDSIPDATDEEIGKISVGHLTKIMEAIMEVNQVEGVNVNEKQLIKRIKDGRLAKAGNKEAK